MKNIFLTIVLLFSNSVFSQDFPTGVIRDDNWYDSLKKDDIDSYSFDGLPKTKSLKNFVPYANNQGNLGSCVAQSIGYGALTTMWAIKKNIENRKSLTSDAFSALYLYNNYVNSISNDCSKGMTYSYAFDFLMLNGDVRFKDFEQDNPDNCNLNPFTVKTEKYKIQSYKRVFNRNDKKDIKVETTRYYLSNNIPVIVMFEITDEMNNKIIKDNGYYYKPSIFSEIIGYHSMLITGYDDDKERIEVLNSWGTNWGNNGFMYISYLDFSIYCKYGFVIELYN